MIETRRNDQFSAWNPGIEADIPPAFREIETIYDSANVFTTFDEVKQLTAETGLGTMEWISFRPQRLALHELIVRVTADIVVVEGEAEEDLGINFRTITRKIFDQYIEPALPDIQHSYDLVCSRIEQLTQAEIGTAIERLSPPGTPPATLWQRLTGGKPEPASRKNREEREFDLLNEFKSRGRVTHDELESAVLRSLYRVLGAIVRTRGFIGNDPQYLTHLCTLHASNYLASHYLGRQIAMLVSTAVAQENLDLIPNAEKPVLFSLKGASASGKSWLRPMLRSKIARLGISDTGYGTISPDIWRKLLLDYDTLGDSHKYAGRFTSHEVGIIDSKLDRYIRDKAEEQHSIPHLVVDRFRFDSFASEKIARVLHKTYVRYIDTLYMYFIVTPPEATVERGWARGLERGRYKAVEDYLGHCVEAYEGMPKVLFKWLAYDQPRYSFKFMDNSVPKGTDPILIARGTQGWMQVFEPKPLIDIERYQRINISATTAEQVTAPPNELKVKNNLGFLRQCIKRIEHIEFVDAASSITYLSIHSGKFKIGDQKLFELKLVDDTLQQIIAELAVELLSQ